MRILVDQDDVIASWGPQFDRMLDTYGEAAAGIPRSSGQTNWNLNAGRTKAEKEIIEEIMVSDGFYRHLEPIAGAKSALKAALKAGHDVRIVSAPYISNPTCASDKMGWIVRYYGSHWGSRLVLTNDKTVVHGDLLIDDRPEISGSMTPTWQHVVFGNYAYNRHITDRHRLVDWKGFNDLISKLENRP